MMIAKAFSENTGHSSQLSSQLLLSQENNFTMVFIWCTNEDIPDPAEALLQYEETVANITSA